MPNCKLICLFYCQFILIFFEFDGVTAKNNEFYNNIQEDGCPYLKMRSVFPNIPKENVGVSRGESELDYKFHPCRRKCIPNQTMTCYYYMIVHYDETMSASCDRYLEKRYRFKYDGQEYIDPFMVRQYNGFDDCKYADGQKTPVMVVNGHLPGSVIEVCEGDTIVADIINGMHESTSMHWHGIHNKKTPHMDGVPHVTQYPIEAGQAFRYRFEADHAGTHWWHGHTEHHRAFGMAGGLIVRTPDNDNLHLKRYDYDLTEHVIMLQDWLYDWTHTIASSMLVNGLGRRVLPGNKKTPTYYETFSVAQGGRYRFRVIFNGISNCPTTMSIDGHDLIIIASDGNDIEPVTVQRLTLHGGERFDFILHANNEIGNYWVRFKGYNFCDRNQIHQQAILHYKGAKTRALPSGPVNYEYEAGGIEMNPIHVAPTNTGEFITIPDTTALEKIPEPAYKPYKTYYTSMAVYQRNDGSQLFQMDDITFQMPTMSLLQTRKLGINKFFCNRTQLENSGFNCRRRHCRCPNVINVPAFKNIEFVFSSLTNTAHPIHLHGYTFRVVGMGELGEENIRNIEEIDRKTPLPRRTQGAPLKDSVTVPAFGYTIVRFYSDSPGYWNLHCHYSIHSENGMGAVVRIGVEDEMKTCPVSNCGLCTSVA